jgi:CDP-glycerol glycerophosphotransferase (TagB/SpsB family)
LNFKSKFISSKFIGSGNKAYTFLNTLECDVCVLTTPGLDTLQIRRSKGVQHYAYVSHSPLDMGKYKLFSFDAFDTIFISGGHQEKSIRELEALRGTHSKSLIKAGCPYMDELGKKLESAITGSNDLKNKTKRILLAPTWGENNLLRILKISTLESLLNAGYHITIRPHPQSRVSELPLLDRFKKKLIKYESIEWDEAPDNFKSLLSADIVISDISGITFDFAFIFQKPVITIIFDYNFLGQEANDIPHQLWEMSMLKKIGATLEVSEVERLPHILQTTLNEHYKIRDLNKLRDENLYNFNKSGEVIAEHLRSLA